jgi:hypothetical protein
LAGRTPAGAGPQRRGARRREWATDRKLLGVCYELGHLKTAALCTIRDAVEHMTATGKQRQARQHWQRAAKLILSKSDVMAVSWSLELALFMDAKLDVSRVPAK